MCCTLVICRIKIHLLFSLLLVIFTAQFWYLHGLHFVLSRKTLNPAFTVAGALLFILHLVRPCVSQHLYLTHIVCISEHILESCFAFLRAHSHLVLTCTFFVQPIIMFFLLQLKFGKEG